MKPCICLLLAIALSLASLRADDRRRLSYDPTVVTLTGTIVEQRYGDDSSPMDRGKSAWILRLDAPVSVAENPGDTTDTEEKNVTEIHLNADHAAQPISQSEFGKTRFMVTGTLYHAHNWHHLRPVVMTVSDLSPTGGPADTAWRTYTDPELGSSLQCPASLVAGSPPAGPAGFEFHTTDNEFSVLVCGGRHRSESENAYIDLTWQSELDTLGNTITYKRKGDGWYVVSGVGKAGVEYYRKVVARHGEWRAFAITYPHAKNQKYDRWVERIAKTFVPFPP